MTARARIKRLEISMSKRAESSLTTSISSPTLPETPVKEAVNGASAPFLVCELGLFPPGSAKHHHTQAWRSGMISCNAQFIQPLRRRPLHA